MADVVQILKTGTTEVTAPAGAMSVAAHLIGPGGAGRSSPRNGGGGAAGVGALFAVTEGEKFALNIPAGGSSLLTTFASVAGSTRSASADYGRNAGTTSNTGAAGGLSANCVVVGADATLYANSGGTGGGGFSTAAGGGGGAGGPDGPGGAGGATGSNNSSGGGGGGNGGGRGSAGTGGSGSAAGGLGNNGGGRGGAGAGSAGAGASAGEIGYSWQDSATGEDAGAGGGGGGRYSAGLGSQYGGGGGGGNQTAAYISPGVIVLIWAIRTGPAGTSLAAGTSALSVAGSASNLLRGFTLPAARSAFAVMGVPAGIKRARIFNVSPGSLRAQGNVVGLLAGHVLPAAGLPLSASAGDGTLRAARRFDASAVALTFAGGAAVLTRIGRRVLDARPRAIGATGAPAKLSRTRLITAAAASFVWDGVAALFGIEKPFTPAPPERTLAVRAQRRFVLATRQVRLIRISKDHRMLIWPAKHVGEVLDYALDWTDRLDGDEIVDSRADVIADNVTVAAERFDGAVQTVWLSGSKPGPCSVLLTVTTASKRTFQEAVRLIVAP